MGKTNAMYYGELRAQNRTKVVAAAQAAFKSGDYKESTRLAKLAVRLASPHNPKQKSKLIAWRNNLIARMPRKANAASTPKP